MIGSKIEKCYLLGCGKDLSGVGGDGVDGRFVGVDFSQLLAAINVPHLEEATTTSGQQTVTARHEGQATDPILVRIIDGLTRPNRKIGYN